MDSIRSELNNIVLLLATECVDNIVRRNRKRKRVWVKDWISRRENYGASCCLLKELRQEDIHSFRNHLRMLPEKFDELLGKIENKITKQDTHMRNSIPAKTKLEITLRFLATGDSYVSLEALYRVGKSTIAQFVPVVCGEIATALKDFIKIPTRPEWEQAEHGFRTKWNFPGCIGAIDGKHINISAPDDTSNYFNYKGIHSVILLALVDDNYCFSYIDKGCNGRASDGGLFKRSSLGQALERNALDIPDHAVIVGDVAFPLKKYLMKPFSTMPTQRERTFNYRLSRARRIVENAFGILVSRFRILEATIALSPEKVDNIVLAACSIHNWLRKTTDTYITHRCVDYEDIQVGNIIEGSWRHQIKSRLQDLRTTRNNHSSKEATSIRNTYADLFITTEKLTWQERMINITG